MRPPLLAPEEGRGRRGGAVSAKGCWHGGAEFRSLVDGGHLPKGKQIGGHVRWDVEELRQIIRGEAVAGMGCVQW